MKGSATDLDEIVDQRTDGPDSIVVGLTIPVEDFILQETLTAVPEATFASKRIVQSGGSGMLPLLWVRGAEREELESALEADCDVDGFSLLAEADGKCLYQMEWADHLYLLLEMLTNAQATVLDLYGTAQGWSLHVLYPSRESLSESIEFCETRNFSADVQSIQQFDCNYKGRYGLTAKQYEALMLAYEEGYFSVARETDLKALADRIGVSHQALSERLRRSIESLLEHTIVVEPHWSPQ